MDYWAVALIIGSAILHAMWNLFAKNSLDKYVFSWWMKLFEFLFYMPIGVYLAFTTAVPMIGWIIALVSGIVHTAYWLLLSASYTHGDLSVVYPISRSAPIIVSIIAVLFLGEKLSATGMAGIIIVMLGVYALSIDSLNLKKLLSPGTPFRNLGVFFAVLTAFSVTAYTIVDKYGSSYFNPLLFVWTEKWISIIPFTLLTATQKRQHVKKEWVKNKWPIIAAGLLSPLSYAMIVFAMQMVQVSYIVSIRQISVVFGVVLAGTLLKEENVKTRFFSSILIFAGLVLISIS